jgi:hypothetical protein
MGMFSKELGKLLGNALFWHTGKLRAELEKLQAAEALPPPRNAAEVLALGCQDAETAQAAQPQHLTVTMKPYQRVALGWMQQAERGPGMLSHILKPLLLARRSDGARQRYYYSVLTGKLTRTTPERITGGFLSQAMGLVRSGGGPPPLRAALNSPPPPRARAIHCRERPSSCSASSWPTARSWARRRRRRTRAPRRRRRAAPPFLRPH